MCISAWRRWKSFHSLLEMLPNPGWGLRVASSFWRMIDCSRSTSPSSKEVATGENFSGALKPAGIAFVRNFFLKSNVRIHRMGNDSRESNPSIEQSIVWARCL